MDRRWYAAGWIVAGFLCVASVFVWSRRRPPEPPTIASVSAAYRLESRAIESRLSSGFAWAPFRPPTRVAHLDAPTLAAVAALMSLSDSAAKPDDANRAAGIAAMLTGQPGEALQKLTSAAESLQTAAAWSDVSAALQESALRQDAPELLAEALAAADRALTIDDHFSEALFNRALAMERLGLNEDAREAWKRYLMHDGGSAWAQEARGHLQALAPEPPFLDLLDREYDHVISDPATAMHLVSHDPFAARAASTTDVLRRWGKAVLQGADGDAARHLAVARRVGDAVARIGGDRMLERAVAAIDSADSETRLALARAHVDYADGLKMVQSSRPVDAEPILRRAAATFERARSPMALPALTFAANTVYEQDRHEIAEHELERLLPMLTGDFGGYRALLLWQLGNCRKSRGDWGAAIATYEESVALFDALDERQNAAAVRRVLSFAYERVGNPAAAWKYRVAALRGAGGRSTLALQKAIASITDAAILDHNWYTASSFATLEIDVSQRLLNDLQRADALLRRAVVRDRLGDAAAAQADVREANAVGARVRDPLYRDFLRNASMRATAMLSATPATSADSLLTQVIDFESARNERLELPALFLERARVRRRQGLVDAALSDVRTGIAEIETQRQSLPEGESRWGAFHAAEDLFDVGVDLALSQNDPAAAFQFAERKRARALLESYGRSPRSTCSDCRRPRLSSNTRRCRCAWSFSLRTCAAYARLPSARLARR